jgi:hypothetical protein
MKLNALGQIKNVLNWARAISLTVGSWPGLCPMKNNLSSEKFSYKFKKINIHNFLWKSKIFLTIVLVLLASKISTICFSEVLYPQMFLGNLKKISVKFFVTASWQNFCKFCWNFDRITIKETEFAEIR